MAKFGSWCKKIPEDETAVEKKDDLIHLTNPKGQVRDFTTREFHEYLEEVVKCDSFKRWNSRVDMPVHFTHDGEKKLNVWLVEAFLKEKGYKWN